MFIQHGSSRFYVLGSEIGQAGFNMVRDCLGGSLVPSGTTSLDKKDTSGGKGGGGGGKRWHQTGLVWPNGEEEAVLIVDLGEESGWGIRMGNVRGAGGTRCHVKGGSLV